MRLPAKDDPGGDREGAVSLSDVLTVLRRHDVTVEVDRRVPTGDVCCTMTSDTTSEVHFLPDPVGGLMVKYLARKFDVPVLEFYFFRDLDEQQSRGPVQ